MITNQSLLLRAAMKVTATDKHLKLSRQKYCFCINCNIVLLISIHYSMHIDSTVQSPHHFSSMVAASMTRLVKTGIIKLSFPYGDASTIQQVSAPMNILLRIKAESLK
jgi:hypothetical protein